MSAYTVDLMKVAWRDGTVIAEVEWEVRDDTLPNTVTIGLVSVAFDADDVYCNDSFTAYYFPPSIHDVPQLNFTTRRDAVEWIKARYEEDKE